VAHLWFEVTMDISQFVEFVDPSKHLANVESGMSFFEDARVVQERSKISTRDILHSEVYKLWILEGVE
jgi:hypothetical protein